MLSHKYSAQWCWCVCVWTSFWEQADGTQAATQHVHWTHSSSSQFECSVNIITHFSTFIEHLHRCWFRCSMNIWFNISEDILQTVKKVTLKVLWALWVKLLCLKQALSGVLALWVKMSLLMFESNLSTCQCGGCEAVFRVVLWVNTGVTEFTKKSDVFFTYSVNRPEFFPAL